MTNARDYFTGRWSQELFELVAGARLGAGIGRVVHVNRLDPTTVIKFEYGHQSFQNAMEWQVWQKLREHERSAKWLAPIEHISPCGLIMIQKRTEPIPFGQLPTQVPVWATDTKQENWGWYEDRPVMHDYGYSNLISRGASKALRTPEWWKANT